MADASKRQPHDVRSWIAEPHASSRASSQPGAFRRESAVSRTLTFIESKIADRAPEESSDAQTRTKLFGSAHDPTPAAGDGPTPPRRPGRELVRVEVEPRLRAWRLRDASDDALDVTFEPTLARDDARVPVADVEAVALEARLDPSLVVATKPASPQAASFRIMRHRLAERGSPRVVLVTSASDGEGKSVAAANLALALAEGGRARVLLVDAHPQRPRQAALFGVEAPEGFFAQLARNGVRGEGPWTIGELEGANLHLLAAGAPTPGTALDGRAFRAAMASLRERYDHVVVDAPAVLTSADVSVIEDAADAVVFVARGRQARARTLRRALEQIAPSRLLGTMLLEG